MKLYGVTGWKNSGKTGLMERLIAEFTARGFSVSSIKHAHHSVDVDHPGKDSHRHRMAGANEVILATRSRVAIMQELRGAEEPSLADLLARLSPVDLVLIEGYKRDRHPKIECRRCETAQTLIAMDDPTIHAIASDEPIEIDRPVFDLNDTGAIADFISAELNLV
jgi:molybdopterin-guanine dinucleotide biosynthesis protein B